MGDHSDSYFRPFYATVLPLYICHYTPALENIRKPLVLYVYMGYKNVDNDALVTLILTSCKEILETTRTFFHYF